MAKTNRKIQLIVGVAILGLLIAVPAISAHDDGPAFDDEPIANDTDPVDEPVDWLTTHANAHAGVNTTAWMNAHTKPDAIEWMHGQDEGHNHHTEAIHDEDIHAQDDHSEDIHAQGDHSEDTHTQDNHGGMHGEGHGC